MAYGLARMSRASTTSMDNEKPVPRIVWTTGWVSFFTDLSTELIYGILPAFYTASLHLSILWMGLVEGAAETIVSISKLFSGHWSDRTGRRKWWMVVGYSLSTISKPLLGLADGGASVLVLRGVDRFGKGIRGAPRDAMLSRELDEDLRGRSFGIQRGMDHAGALAGGLVAAGLLMSKLVTMRDLFWWSALPGVLAVLVILLFVRERAPKVACNSASPALNLRAAWQAQSRKVKRYLVVVALFSISNSTDLLLLKLAYDQFRAAGLSEHIAYGLLPLLWAWLHVVKAVSSPWGGRLSDELGRAALIRGGWFIYALIYTGFALWDSLASPWILFGIYGLYYGLVEGPERALMADLIENPDQRGMAYGLFHFVTGLCALPASLLLAGLWLTFNHRIAFGTGAVLALIAAATLPWALRE